MADIAASDVSYAAVTRKASPSDPRMEVVATITYGNGTLTYPAGGIPLTGAKLGCPTVIEEFSIMDSGASNSNQTKYDAASNKLRIYSSGTELVAGTTAPASMSIRVRVVGW